MSRQTATLVALWSIVGAAVVLALASWVRLWRHLRARRAAGRDGSDADRSD